MSRLPRRSGAELAAASLDAVAPLERARSRADVHSVRVASKRLRSFWRVLERSVGRSASRRRRRDLSRAAGFLAAPRERDALRALAKEIAASRHDLAPSLRAFSRRPPAPADSSWNAGFATPARSS